MRWSISKDLTSSLIFTHPSSLLPSHLQHGPASSPCILGLFHWKHFMTSFWYIDYWCLLLLLWILLYPLWLIRALYISIELNKDAITWSRYKELYNMNLYLSIWMIYNIFVMFFFEKIAIMKTNQPTETEGGYCVFPITMDIFAN